MKNKVLLLIKHLADGGAERVVSLWAQTLTDAGYTVTVLTYYPCPNEYALDPRVTRVNMFANAEKYSQLAYKIVRCKKSLERYLTKHPQDLVIPFLIENDLLAAIAHHPQAKAITQTVRNSPWDEEQEYNLVTRDWAIRKQGSVILQNTEQMEYFNTAEFKHIKKYVVHNPLHPAIEKIKKTDYRAIKKIVAVGRLVPQKNHALMIEAIRILRDEFHENYQLDIYGAGKLQETLQAQIDQANLGNQVKLCGRSDDIFHVLINYDLFLMTSLYEGTPNALLEAMGLGLPSLAIKCRTGITELIDNDKNGYILDSYDAHDLAKKIRTINNHTQLERIGKQARQDMTRYATANIQAELVAVVQSLIAKPPKSVSLYPALKQLQTIMLQQSPNVQAIYYQKYFDITLHLIKHSDYRTGKRLFKRARKILKDVAITTESFSQKRLYQICLKHNQFKTLFALFRELDYQIEF